MDLKEQGGKMHVGGGQLSEMGRFQALPSVFGNPSQGCVLPQGESLKAESETGGLVFSGAWPLFSGAWPVFSGAWPRGAHDITRDYEY